MALVLVVVLATSAIGFAGSDSDETMWTQEAVQAMWSRIQRTSAANVPDVTFHVTEGDRAYVEVATLKTYLPREPMNERVLWHEAGHTVHIANPELVHEYLRLRDLRGIFANQWWEAFAEDFAVCHVGGTQWSYWRFMGPPPREVCDIFA